MNLILNLFETLQKINPNEFMSFSMSSPSPLPFPSHFIIKIFVPPPFTFKLKNIQSKPNFHGQYLIHRQLISRISSRSYVDVSTRENLQRLRTNQKISFNLFIKKLERNHFKLYLPSAHILLK